jgi:hypothetical protein
MTKDDFYLQTLRVENLIKKFELASEEPQKNKRKKTRKLICLKMD